MSSISDQDKTLSKIKDAIATSMGININQVHTTLSLLEEGNSIPFIARYRKERTGSLDETQIRTIEEQYRTETRLNQEKEKIIAIIREQGKLTDELEFLIKAAITLTELQEIYKPYKLKKITKGQLAKDKGLEPLTAVIWEQEFHTESLEELAFKYLNKDLELITVNQVLEGARHIIAENIANTFRLRDLIRLKFFKTVKFVTKKSILYKIQEEENPNSQKVLEGKKYSQYFEYEENALTIPPHRLLAINRGDREGVLSFRVEFNDDEVISTLEEEILKKDGSEEYQNQIKIAIVDSWKRLLGPSLQREIKRIQIEKAEIHSIKLFSENLKHLLLTPPIKERILGIDPAYRTGCKYAAINEVGDVLITGTIYPHKPILEIDKSKTILKTIINQYQISFVAIGNGTGSRETEQLISELAKEINIKYAIVNEAGASVYSASEIAREEFPDLDVSIRGAISIARRFQDPLAEYVKIDPKSIGVGQYQHDLTGLSTVLKDVVIDTVNLVGADLNTASEALLNYISGITKPIAKNILKYRAENGAFIYRLDLKKVQGIGPRIFEQCAGFLRISGSPEPFDNTPIHPESYNLAEKLIKLAKLSKNYLIHNREKFRKQINLINPQWAAQQLNCEDQIETITDILKALQNPFRDPREDFDKPLLRSEVLSIEDLTVGMELEGTITNIVDFGAFVDIGVKTNGLVHISEISSTTFVKHPRDAGLKVGDILKVKVKEIDLQRKRISLTLRIHENKLNDNFSTGNSKEDRKIDSFFRNGRIQL